MGPLNVKDMTAEDCMLEWRPPKDDGGMPISHYIVEKCDESMGGRYGIVGVMTPVMSSQIGLF